MTTEASFLADLRALRDRIAGPFGLCEFLDVSECEDLIAQTVHAACNNLDRHGEPFSFLGAMPGPYEDAYRFLVEGGYFREDSRQGRRVIFPTRKLLDKLLAFFPDLKPREVPS